MNSKSIFIAATGIACGLVIGVACLSGPSAPAATRKPERAKKQAPAEKRRASQKTKPAPAPKKKGDDDFDGFVAFGTAPAPKKKEAPPAPKPVQARKPAKPAPARQAEGRLPEGHSGIAARYPGDVGIENDPAVILVESFEDSVDAVCGRWETVSDPEMMSKSQDVPPGSGGKTSILLKRVPGLKYTGGGQFYRRIKNKQGGFGYDQVFARFYMKFNKEHAPIHHYGTHIGGYNPPQRWAMMNAGHPTPGNLAFHTGVEPGNFSRWHFYTYWQHMRGSPPRGQTWGNGFQFGVPAKPIPKEKWICIEVMIKVNDIGKSNGEQAFWIDGKLNRKDGTITSHIGPGFPTGTWSFDKFHPGSTDKGIRWSKEKGGRVPTEGGKPFEGFEWRSVPELKVNYVWLYRYMSKAETGKSLVWWDHVVLATQYIGPITPKK